MIADVQACMEAEFKSQVEYLAHTPVCGIAALLSQGRCNLRKGVVRSAAALGRLKTEFGVIGYLEAPAHEGQRKFRVSEVLPLLRANPGADDGLLAKIQAFIEKDERGEVEYNTTIVHLQRDFIIKDGNKRAIALFERATMSARSVELPVFLVDGFG